ncbi:hypothetical protein EMPG_10390 [Blastomyces silverae]|uniref:Uncharacterized protein n=1 Tax=Blastomyces silverae TaxID=2060906 RepID=A0A0H1BAA2_9EURO|nr:hypothetical protein EMPG_10390 [Blastomyces silverae]
MNTAAADSNNISDSNNSESKTQLTIIDSSEFFQMMNFTEIINISLIFISYNSFINYRLIDSFNECLYISKDIIFQKNLHLMNSLTLFTQDLKI